MELSNKEKKEVALLEKLENSKVEYTSHSNIWGVLLSYFTGDWSKKPRHQRKNRLVELRTKHRLYKEGKNTKDNFDRYYEIRKEEAAKM
jgi:hypothetical protein